MSKSFDHIKNNEIDYEFILNNLNIGFYKGEFQGKLLKHNSAFNRIFGYPPDQSLIGSEARQFLIYSNEIEKYYSELLEKDYVKNLTVHIKDKNGNIKIAQLNSRLIRDKYEKPIEVEGTFIDITEQYETHQKLKESEERYRIISDYSKDVIFTMDMTMKFTYISPSIIDLLGYTPDEMIGNTAIKYNTPPSLKIIGNAFKEELKIDKKGKSNINRVRKLELQQIKKNGSIVDVELVCTFLREIDGRPRGILGVSRNITERKRIEKELRESEEKFRTITEQSLIGIAIIQDGKIKYANDNLLDLLDYSMEEINKWGPQGFANVIHPNDREFVMEQTAKKQKGQGEVINHYEIRLIKKNEEIKIMDNYSKTINYKGKPADLAVLVDITKRKRSNIKLKESENQLTERIKELRCLYNISMIFESSKRDIDEILQNIIKIIPSAFQFPNSIGVRINYGKKEYKSTNFKLSDYKLTAIENIFEKILELEIYCYEQIEFLKEEADLIIEISHRLKNFLENLISENALMEEKKFTEIAINSQRDTFFLFNPTTGKAFRWNKAFSDISGYSHQEIALLKAPDSYYGEVDLKKLPKIIQTIKNGGTTLNELTLITKNGGKIPFEYSASGLFDENKDLKYIIAIGRDITERKISEQKIKQSEEKYRLLVENAHEGIWAIDEKAHTTYANKRMAEILGYTEEQMMGKHLFEFMDYSKIENAKMMIERRIKDIKEQHDFEFLKKDGSTIFTRLETSPLRDENGNYIGAVAFIADITENKITEEKIKESEKLYKHLSIELETILDLIPGLLYCKDNNDIIIRVNQNFADYLKVKKEDMIEKTTFDFFPTEQAQKYRNDDLEVIRSGKPMLNIEEFGDFPDGKVFAITNKVPQFNDKREIVGVIGLTIDVTKQKTAEYKLKESEKLYREAYDRASFFKELIAHDMNNILQAIQSSVELFTIIQNQPEDFKYKKNIFDIITNQVFRGAKIVSNIIKLSELEETEIAVTNIEVSHILKESIEHIIKSFQGLDIDIKIETDLNKFYLKANNLLTDLFENLLINAIKHNENFKKEILIHISRIKKNNMDYIRFGFIDNGLGIPDEVKRTLFEKTLNKKAKSKGLGIGLSLVKQIITIYHGEIEIENRIKEDYAKGSKFIILIPEAD